MTIGIDGSRAFLRDKTGIEHYSFQVIKHLTKKLAKSEVVLYLNGNQKGQIEKSGLGFELPDNWEIKYLSAPRFWTQLRLSWEMLTHPVDVLYVPSHVIPFIHPRKTIATVHGLEYEFYPEAYFWGARLYMRFFIKKSCRWASRIIAVSNNTKKDLVNLYKIPQDKISIVYEGLSLEDNIELPASLKRASLAESRRAADEAILAHKTYPYLLFIGRLEKRKNIVGMIKAFDIAKSKYKIPHKLFLIGSVDYGRKEIFKAMEESPYSSDINAPGYVSDEVREQLMKNADIFMFATFYEGFGLPILEAQSVGVPVVASDNSSIPEVMGDSGVLVDPKNANEIAEAVHKILGDADFRNGIIEKGYANFKRFSWDKCASEIAEIIQIYK